MATSARPSGVRRPATAQLLLPVAPSAVSFQLPIANSQGSIRGLLLQGANAIGSRELVVGTSWRLANPAAAQVVNIRTRDRGNVERIADNRRVPLGADRREEVGDRFGQHVVHGAERCLVRSVGILQGDEHGQDHEHAVFGEPLPRLLPQQLVFERRRPKLAQAAVHPGGVGVEDAAPHGIHSIDRAPGFSTKSMACESAGRPRAPEDPPAPKARPRPVGARDPSGRNGPARAESRWRARCPRATGPVPSGCRERLA